MAGVNYTFKAIAIITFAAAVLVYSVSAQDISEAPAAAPVLDTGSAYACGVSGAMLWSSFIIASLAIFKHY